jgi:Family of unknown function (DUF7019)
VERYVRAHFAVGTVDEPAEYFEGTLEMRWGRVESGWGGVSDAGAVWFGGKTADTALGLAGSLAHVIGPVGQSAVEEDLYSDYPDLLHAVSHAADPIRLPEALVSDDDANTVALQAATATHSQRGAPENLSFLARTVGAFTVGPEMVGLAHARGWGTHYLFGIPLYVARDGTSEG